MCWLGRVFFLFYVCVSVLLPLPRRAMRWSVVYDCNILGHTHLYFFSSLLVHTGWSWTGHFRFA